MAADSPTIVATSGGYRPGDRSQLAFNSLLLHAIERSGVGGRRPRLAYLPTACGDQLYRIAAVAEAARIAGIELVPVTFFTMPNHDDVTQALLDVDAVWVDGGSVANLLAVWSVHGVGPAMRQAWQAGVVLAGVSAGSICWFTGGTTDSFGPQLRPVTNGLALLPYANGVHYDSEARRRPLVHELVADGTLGQTHCTDDGAGLVYENTTLVDVIAERDGAFGYRVHLTNSGVVEEQLDTRRL